MIQAGVYQCTDRAQHSQDKQGQMQPSPGLPGRNARTHTYTWTIQLIDWIGWEDRLSKNIVGGKTQYLLQLLVWIIVIFFVFLKK